jgi:DNA-binding response OmpR family regulator
MADHKIIVVEDDRDFREIMVKYLSLAGIEVTATSSALEFYSSIAKEPYQIAVLDIGLPDQNGLVLAEFIRKNTNMRIVMLTAQASIYSKLSAYRSGADIYLVKPIDLAELVASIQSLLGRLTLDGEPATVQEWQPTEPAPVPAPAPAQTVEPHWSLLRQECALVAPQGSKVSLTSKEFDFLEKLAASPNEVVERQTLLQALVYDTDELGNKALDSMVHRLRRKKDDLEIRIPLKTIHGVGYAFFGSIVIV